MEALKQNFLLRGYFRKKEKQERKEEMTGTVKDNWAYYAPNYPKKIQYNTSSKTGFQINFIYWLPNWAALSA